MEEVLLLLQKHGVRKSFAPYPGPPSHPHPTPLWWRLTSGCGLPTATSMSLCCDMGSYFAGWMLLLACLVRTILCFQHVLFMLSESSECNWNLVLSKMAYLGSPILKRLVLHACVAWRFWGRDAVGVLYG